MSLALIQSSITEDMRAVDAVIRKSLHSEVVLINQVADYIINSGGKRLRPALVLLSAGVFGKIETRHHKLAAVVEFIHTATLLHDDVVDESALRRGRATANTLFGNAASVLVGDFVYSRAFQMMVGVQNMRVMDILAEATNIIAEGEVLQLLNINDADISDDDYLRVIHYKTAKLFEAATRLGAVICQASTEDENAMAEYGMRLGTAFQLIDDVLDYEGDSSVMGKNLGDDLREGKVTLPVIHALENTHGAERDMLINAIEHASDSNLDQVLALVRRTGGVAAARKAAEAEAELAIDAAMQLPDSIYRQALVDLASTLQNRAS